MSKSGFKWTHPSVLLLEEEGDPITAITDRAREVVVAAMDAGWTGPPFDPIGLAEHLKLEVVPRDDVRDARTVPAGSKLRIEFNPNRSRGRVRYSLAHEIAHTLFHDCRERVRNRALHEEMTADEWQLELLCNVGAAELLMPIANLPPLSSRELSIDRLMELRERFDVSAEALLIRVVKTTEQSCLMFAASRVDTGSMEGRYRLDYLIGSRGISGRIPRGLALPRTSVVAQCTAIGFTAKGDETWLSASSRMHVEAVGVRPYPGSSHPRVVGVLTALDAAQAEPPAINYLKGDAREPRGGGLRLLAHVVNDKTANWGGGGFAAGLARRWPDVQREFRLWAQENGLKLGKVHFAPADTDTLVANMVAQRGYGPSPTPRIRYGALRDCLLKVAAFARDRSASVHMPRIGCGLAGGSWDLVQELVTSSLVRQGLSVTVYDPPGSRSPGANSQRSLSLQA